jgi:hypothetical protein
MWRRLIARAHLDRGGDGALFVWANAVREHVAGGAIESPRTPCYAPVRDNRERIPFYLVLGYIDDFVDLTHRALSVGQLVEEASDSW